MKQISITIAIIGILVLSSCAMSAVRDVLPADALSLNISLGGAVVDNIQGFDFLPVPANLSIGATYGITDQATVGLNLYPFTLFGGSLVFEPLGIYNFIQQEDAIPAVNGALSIPVSISFKTGEVGFYPTLSIAPVYENETGRIYTALDFMFDSTTTSASFALKFGGDWKAWESGTVGAEIGLIRIGQQSMVSPLSRASIGIPAFTIGTSIYLLNP